jgi:hypothetical protein
VLEREQRGERQEGEGNIQEERGDKEEEVWEEKEKESLEDSSKCGKEKGLSSLGCGVYHFVFHTALQRLQDH